MIKLGLFFLLLPLTLNCQTLRLLNADSILNNSYGFWGDSTGIYTCNFSYENSKKIRLDDEPSSILLTKYSNSGIMLRTKVFSMAETIYECVNVLPTGFGVVASFTLGSGNNFNKSAYFICCDKNLQKMWDLKIPNFDLQTVTKSETDLILQGLDVVTGNSQIFQLGFEGNIKQKSFLAFYGGWKQRLYKFNTFLIDNGVGFIGQKCDNAICTYKAPYPLPDSKFELCYLDSEYKIKNEFILCEDCNRPDKVIVSHKNVFYTQYVDSAGYKYYAINMLDSNGAFKHLILYALETDESRSPVNNANLLVYGNYLYVIWPATSTLMISKLDFDLNLIENKKMQGIENISSMRSININDKLLFYYFDFLKKQKILVQYYLD